MQFRIIKDTNIDFIRLRKLAYGLSILVILAGVVSITLRGGVNLGTEFVGGTSVSLKFENPIDVGEIRQALIANDLRNAEIQSFLTGNEVNIRVKRGEGVDERVAGRITDALSKEFPNNKLTVGSSLLIGPSMGSFLFNRSIAAMLLSFAGIIIYVAFRFRNVRYGVTGVLAITHDVFIALAFLSFFDKEVTVTIVAALLAVAGYSINDTIVVYDRIRETSKGFRGPMGDLINRSFNDTLSRTIITSLTLLFVILALFFYGGEVLHDFAFTLLVGVIAGTYSTIFISSSIFYDWQSWSARRESRAKSSRPGRAKPKPEPAKGASPKIASKAKTTER